MIQIRDEMMWEMEEQKTLSASSTQLAACPGEETIARGKWRVFLVIIFFFGNAVLLLMRSCQTYK